MSGSVRVLIVDDHPLFRSGLRMTLSSVEGLEVVGEAASGEQAIAASTDLARDVVVMDVSMPGMSGVKAIGRSLGSARLRRC